MTYSEISFYDKLKQIGADYYVFPQINLASIVDKKYSVNFKNPKRRNELFRNIDFGIFDKNFKLLLLIELNDSSHNSYERRDRDLKVQKILNDCNIKLLKFQTKYPNEKDYVVNRVLNAINKNN